ncbi:MAG: hypothetical protein WCO56_14520 [Verrucomicrobiota bacterium]
MKIQRLSTRPTRASVLVIVLITSAILGFILASYLILINAQNRSVTRSQTWNSVMPIVEAGIEEALAHLNKNGLTNLFLSPWTNVSGMAVTGRSLNGGGYMVSITTNVLPVIECSGYTTPPTAFGYLPTEAPPVLFAQIANQPTTAIGARKIYRSVRVTTSNGALFAKGMVARGGISFAGQNVTTDSFDSADPNYSTNGQWDPAKRKGNGDVASNSGGANIVDIGNGNVIGHAATGPGGTIAVGSGGVIGDLAFVSGGGRGIEAGHASSDMNQSFPDVVCPFAGGFSPNSGSISTTNYSFGTSVVTTVNMPSPMPNPPITTNVGLTITTPTRPPYWPPGGVTRNDIVVTSTLYPTNDYENVTTNTITVTTNAMPTPLPAGVIITNIVVVTNATLPTPAPTGFITTNTAFVYNATVAPSVGPPITYVGTVTNRVVTTGKNKGTFYDYWAIQSYVYNERSYTYIIPNAYTYTMHTYTYTPIVSYTYNVVTTNAATITSQKYDIVLDSYDYVIDNLSGSVYVRGNARLHVTSSISFKGQSGLTIGPGASLMLYMDGASTDIAGNGVLNMSGNAANFQYFGTANNTSINIHGNGGFCGVIYAPYADFTLGGGGNNNQDFIGASVVNSVRMNGHFNFHYDENLARMGPTSRYMITSWIEVGPMDTWLASNNLLP